MRADGLAVELPELTSNPFSAIPLEGDKSDLYVGRLDIRRRIAQYIKFSSTRRILMVGDLGSGRTSLLRCAALEAPVSVHIDHISASNPHESLLQRMYSELVDYELPTNTVELVNRMVDFSQTFTGSLPLIVIDTPNVEDSVLFVALRDVLPSLERLQAVIVVVVESKQRVNIRDSVLHSFDSVETLSPLSIDEVQALIEKRISSVSQENFKLDLNDAKKIHEQTHGIPLEVVKFMRDAIDNSRISGSHQSEHSQAHVKAEPTIGESSKLETSPNDPVPHDGKSEIIDASIPWNQRNPETEDLGIEPSTNLFDFDLDLNGLSESQQSDIPMEEFAYSAGPDTEEVIIPESRPKPNIDAGAFGGLLGRTRDFDEMEKSEPEEMINQLNNHGTELWVSKEMIDVEEKVDFEEHNSAELIYDEVGLHDYELSLDEPEDLSTNEQTITDGNDVQVFDNPTLQNLLLALTNQLRVSMNEVSHDAALYSALVNFNKLNYSKKEDYPLNPAVLSSLNSSESYLLSIAKVRKYSPSDKEILEHLGIKRPRLSQISNKLLKGGILSARMRGRNRYYEMTSSAKAQLIAWGLMAGDE